MTSSGTNLNLQAAVVSPRVADDNTNNKVYGSKLYVSNSSAISGI